MCIGTRYCFIVAATLAALSVALPRASHAQVDLFKEDGAQPLSPEQSRQLSSLQHRPTTAEVRTVRFASLAPLSQGRALTLNVVPGTRFTAENKKVKRISDSTFTWIGEPSGAPGMVVLAVRGDRVTGTIRRDGQLFKVQSLGAGLHAVVRVDERKFPPEHPPDFDGGSYDTDDGGRPRSDTLDAQGSHLQTSSSSSGGDGNIRVLVAYTDDAEAAAGDIDGLVQTAIAETNSSYRMSNISASEASVTLAAARNVGYQEDGRSYSEHIDFLQNPNDGELDIVHTWRDDYYADVVVLLVEDRDECGLAFSIYARNASQAFAVVNQDCATGYYSFGHEIGHLQGARHDLVADPRDEPFPYGHGYVNSDDNWRTIMAVPSKFCPNGCKRIPYWSNPNVSYEGDPTGTAAEENNARVLRETSDEIAAFRPTPLNVTLSGPSKLNSGEQGTWTASVTGGEGSPSYDWEYNPIYPSSGWGSASCTGSSCSRSFANSCDGTKTAGIRVTVTTQTQSETASQTLSIAPSGSGTYASSDVTTNALPCSFTKTASTLAASKGGRRSGHRLQVVEQDEDAVQLAWRAGRSPLPSRFVVEHRADTTGAWSKLGTVPTGDSTSIDSSKAVAYRYRAENLSVGAHQFRLAVAPEGTAKAKHTTGPVTARIELQEAYRLRSYPNPARERATVELAVKEAQDVTVAVYDVLGRRVTTLHRGRLPAQDTKRLSLEASEAGLTSGTYFVRADGEDFVATVRLTVVQ